MNSIANFLSFTMNYVWSWLSAPTIWLPLLFLSFLFGFKRWNGLLLIPPAFLAAWAVLSIMSGTPVWPLFSSVHPQYSAQMIESINSENQMMIYYFVNQLLTAFLGYVIGRWIARVR